MMTWLLFLFTFSVTVILNLSNVSEISAYICAIYDYAGKEDQKKENYPCLETILVSI